MPFTVYICQHSGNGGFSEITWKDCSFVIPPRDKEQVQLLEADLNFLKHRQLEIIVFEFTLLIFSAFI